MTDEQPGHFFTRLTIHTVSEPETLFVSIGAEPIILIEALEAADDFVHFKISSGATREALASILGAISHALDNGTISRG